VLRRKSPKRVAFSNLDRLVFAGLYRLSPGVLDALKILRPQTVIRWHRAGFRAYWRWKSRPCGGRPKTPTDIRRLIHEMSVASPLWGAPRIHGELLKLGIDVGQTTVAKYMARRRQPPSRAPVAERDRTTQRPVDCLPVDRSLRLATDITIHRSRPRLRLWRYRHPTDTRYGHTRSADLDTVAMAKRICREADWFNPTGLS
jgi:hypothetical protein